MKTIIAHISTLFPAINRHLPAIDLSWAKISNYVFTVLKEAFRDNVLSDVEMEFLLLLVTGFLVAAKNSITQLANARHVKIPRIQH